MLPVELKTTTTTVFNTKKLLLKKINKYNNKRNIILANHTMKIK